MRLDLIGRSSETHNIDSYLENQPINHIHKAQSTQPLKLVRELKTMYLYVII
jgi:hypothetical protein